MIGYYGDFAEDETVYIPFNTFSSDDPSASVTITNLVDADIKVHKDGSVTQIVTDGATIAIDFDSITGNHLITVDTSAHADYATGSDYLVRIEGTTVDGATINAWVGSFSIENRYMRGTNSAATAANVATELGTYDGPTKAEMDTAFTEIKGGTWAAGTDTLEHIRNKQTDIETDTSDIQTQVGTAGAGLTDLGGMSAGMQAEVLSEVNDALNTAITELGQGQPTATPSIRTGIMLLYMALRNQVDTEAAIKKIHNNAGTVITKKVLSDDGTTYSEAKAVTGP